MGGLSAENIVLLAAVASVRYAQGKSAEDIELLSAFFEVLANNLALRALSPTVDSADE